MRVSFCLILVFLLSLVQFSSASINTVPKSTSKSNKDTIIVLNWSDSANYYRISGNLPKALKFGFKSLKKASEINWKYGEALSYNDIAYIKLYESDFEGSIKYAVLALKISERYKDDRNIAYANLFIGYTNFCIGEENEILKYYKKALIASKKVGDDYDLGFCYTYIGNYYTSINQNDSAYHYHNLALNHRLKTEDKRSIADSYLLIGKVYKAQDKFDLALANYDNALRIYSSINDKRRLSETYRNYGEINILKKQYQLATENFFKSRDLSIEVGAVENLLPTYYNLSITEEKKKNYLAAYQYVKKYLELKNTFDNQEVYRNTARQILKYKTEKEEKIRKLQYANEKAIQDKNRAALESQNKRKNFILFGAIILILLLSVIAYLIFKSLKMTRNQKNVIEEQNKSITDSITYAKRIQSAILPSTSFLKSIFPSYFIYYRPKDIVAGDFYWVDKTEKHLIFAVADCTGHGVPGAMVSVVCNNALNKAVHEFNFFDPGEVLDKTREIIIKEFSKSDENVQDGMDIALCTILIDEYNQFLAGELDSLNLAFSGANNRLWIVRNDDITEVRPDKFPIGIYSEYKHFTTNHVQLLRNDIIYLFTDGYVDQFGGPNDKKFLLGRFRKLILKISDCEMKEQQTIINDELELWMSYNNTEQVDDVCVMGVKIG